MPDVASLRWWSTTSTRPMEYARLIHEGVRFPAIKVALRPDGTYEIRDGRHRWAAGQLAGRDTILVRHSTRPLKDMRPPLREATTATYFDCGVRHYSVYWRMSPRKDTRRGQAAIVRVSLGSWTRYKLIGQILKVGRVPGT